MLLLFGKCLFCYFWKGVKGWMKSMIWTIELQFPNLLPLLQYNLSVTSFLRQKMACFFSNINLYSIKFYSTRYTLIFRVLFFSIYFYFPIPANDAENDFFLFNKIKIRGMCQVLKSVLAWFVWLDGLPNTNHFIESTPTLAAHKTLWIKRDAVLREVAYASQQSIVWNANSSIWGM